MKNLKNSIVKYLIIFLIVFLNIFKVVNCAKVEVNANLVSPTEKVIITRHPQLIIKYFSDVSPIIKPESIRLLVNNIDYTNYMRIDLNTTELIIFFYSNKPFNIGKNVVKVMGKLINDDIFENEFVINVNPRLSQEVKNYLDLISKTNSNIQKSDYYYRIGLFYEQKGFLLDALGYYSEALKYNTNNSNAKKNFDRLLSLSTNKAIKQMNIVLDVSLINMDVLKRNGLYVFRCIIENYRDRAIEFNLNNFLVSSKSKYYQPIKNPYEHLRKITQKSLMTIDDFAIANYLLTKENFELEYPDNFVVESYSQLKIDLMFNLDQKEVVFQFFKPSEKVGKSQKELPLYIKMPFIL